MWFIALAFLGVGTVSAQTETAEGMDERRKFRVETDPSKFDKLGCRW